MWLELDRHEFVYHKQVFRARLKNVGFVRLEDGKQKLFSYFPT